MLIPIEFFSTFIVRPVTLALRLFANMFAGHMILLVFTLGGFALLGANSLRHQADLRAVLGVGDRADLPRGTGGDPAGVRLRHPHVQLRPGALAEEH